MFRQQGEDGEIQGEYWQRKGSRDARESRQATLNEPGKDMGQQLVVFTLSYDDQALF